MATRHVEIFNEVGNTWVPEQFQNLTSGTIFHMYEPGGSPVTDHTGVYEFRAASDAYQVTISGYGDVWQIDVYDPDPIPIPEEYDI